MKRTLALSHDWLTPIAQALEAHDNHGAFLVALQTYRPHAVRMIADALNLEFCDFRATYMAPKGAQAGRVSLRQLDQVISEGCKEKGIILHNVEALLATKTKQERTSWFSQFVQRPGVCSVLVPLSLYFNEVPTDSDRVVWIDPTTVPQETLLQALAQR